MQQTRNAEFWPRLGITLAVLAAYLLGCNVPLPGLDPAKVAVLAQTSGPAAVERISMLALGVMPLLNALILVEMVKLVAPGVRQWERASRGNRRQMDYLVVGLALFMAFLQAAGVAPSLENVRGLVAEPGMAFRVVCIATLVGSTALVIALVTLIDRMGLGNGLWLLFLAPALAALPQTLAKLSVVSPGAADNAMLLALAFCVLAIGAVVSIVLAARAAPATVATCIWTPIIASTGVSLLLLADMWIATWGAEATAVLSAPGSILWYFALVPAVALVAWLYVRTLSVDGQPSPVPAAPIAATVAAIIVASSVLDTQLGIALPLSATELIVIAAVATSVLVEWGFAGGERAPEEPEEISPRA